LAEPTPAKPDRFSVLTLLLVVVGVALLCGLGVWQVQRLQWKTQLLARIQALAYAPAEPLNVALNHVQAGRDVDFIRVQTPCEPAPPGPAARIYTVTDDGPGWRPVVLCRLKVGPYPAVLVDLGVESEAARPGNAALAPPAALTGVLRTGLRREPFMAMQPQGPGEFGWRDMKGVSAYLGAPNAAPVFLMLEQPAASPTIKPRPTPIDIPNNHLGYAITWFGLAAALIAVYAAALMKRRRKAG
jgi:surfeit locus 1 family protein